MPIERTTSARSAVRASQGTSSGDADQTFQAAVEVALDGVDQHVALQLDVAGLRLFDQHPDARRVGILGLELAPQIAVQHEIHRRLERDRQRRADVLQEPRQRGVLVGDLPVMALDVLARRGQDLLQEPCAARRGTGS